MYKGNKMSIQLKTQLDNTIDRYESLKKQGRNDKIAQLVLNRLEKEINIIKRKLSNEEKHRQKISTRTGASSFTRYISKIMHRYWPKCYGDYYAIPTVPAIETP